MLNESSKKEKKLKISEYFDMNVASLLCFKYRNNNLAVYF